MSGNFYDFDKDEMFSEVYYNKPKKKPVQKEYEVEIPMPKKIVATPVDSPMPKRPPTQVRQKKSKKLSSTALAFSIMGIAVSCTLVFVFSTLAVIFSWRYIPKFEKAEKSVVENVEQIEEYINVSDDGSYVEVVPYYREVEGDDAPPSAKDEKDEDDSSSEVETSDSEDDVIVIE